MFSLTRFSTLDVFPMPRIVVAITGASGAAYAVRLLRRLVAADVEIHLTCSDLGRRLLADEVGIKRLGVADLLGDLADRHGEQVTIYNDHDVGARPASGSFLHDGMIVVPCSANTLGAIAGGLSSNLVQRAAAVTLKERRPLVLAYRECPVSAIDLENMLTLSRAGAVIAPLMPGFYLHPQSIDDLLDFMVGRLMDLVGVPHDLPIRWKP